jgi:hypothetical protein
MLSSRLFLISNISSSINSDKRFFESNCYGCFRVRHTVDFEYLNVTGDRHRRGGKDANGRRCMDCQIDSNNEITKDWELGGLAKCDPHEKNFVHANVSHIVLAERR